MSVGGVIKLKEEPFLLRQRGGKNSVSYPEGTSILLGSFFEGSNTGFVPVVLFFFWWWSISAGGGRREEARRKRRFPPPPPPPTEEDSRKRRKRPR